MREVERVQLGHALFRRTDGKLEYMGKVLPPGPWHSEPDHVEFKEHGFPCLLRRGPGGAWCGYVAVPPGHPWHGKDYNDAKQSDGDYVNVHGGLTYADACQVGGAICHKPEPGEPDDVWWLGFDCNHSGDLAAYDILEGRHNRPMRPGEYWGSYYRTIDYVRSQTERLAAQAKAVAS